MHPAMVTTYTQDLLARANRSLDDEMINKTTRNTSLPTTPKYRSIRDEPRPARETGLNQRATPLKAAQGSPRVVQRKSMLVPGGRQNKLPWLDGKVSATTLNAKCKPPGGFPSSSDTLSSKASAAVTTAPARRLFKNTTKPKPPTQQCSLPALNRTASASSSSSVASPKIPNAIGSTPTRPASRKISAKPRLTIPMPPPPKFSPAAVVTEAQPVTAQSPISPLPVTSESSQVLFPQRAPVSRKDRQSESLTKAITGLENLMQEAVQVAKDAAEHGRPDEVAEVLDVASNVLRRASTVQQAQLKAAPIPMDSEEGSVSSTDDISSDNEVVFSDAASTRSTSPILSNSPQHPVISVQPPINLASIHASVTNSTSPEEVLECGRKRRRSMTATPPHMYASSRRPTVPTIPSARDFAYTTSRTQRSASPSPPSIYSTEEHWTGRRPTRTFTYHPNGPLQVDSSPDIDTEQVSPGTGQDMKNRRLSATEFTPPPWVPPRHNTAMVDPPADRDRGGLRRVSITRPGLEARFSKPYRYGNDTKLPLDEIDDNLACVTAFEKEGKRRHRRRRRGEGEKHSRLGHHTKRQPIARKWETVRKRITATVACINTGMIGFIIGIYAGMVPRIQYVLADQNHYIIQGNVYLFIGLAISTFLFWPLPLLHGRKPYILAAFAIALPLHFPQAVIVSSYRTPDNAVFRTGILVSRFFTGLALGFANVNSFTVLLDLFGASLMSSRPHQEIVMYNDIRRDGGGMGLWLGIWSWCFIASLAVGFISGAGVIRNLNPQWGFYVTIILIAMVLVLNVIAPETRRSAYRRSFRIVVGEDEKVRRKVARGEVKLHIAENGPQMWYEEVGAGLVLCKRMFFQRGFFVLSLYLGWIYAQIVLVIVLLGALLSSYYRMKPQYVGLGVFSIAIGALLAVPLAKANIFSRDRKQGPRTDSMTFETQISWTSHMVRRVIFMLILPFAGLAYTLASRGWRLNYMAPIIFAGLIGFLSNLAIAECNGLIMETFDTSDLQPGVNSKHRLQSMGETVTRRRTNYSSFPRVTAGIMVSQTIGFLLAATATGVGGVMTRRLGAQVSTGVTAGILLFLTTLLTMTLTRYKSVKVIPDHAFGTRVGTGQWSAEMMDKYWKPVIIGNPSGKVRRMNLLELGRQSRWTEIRKLNKLVRE